jgi:Cu/Ag efflux protein CusF
MKAAIAFLPLAVLLMAAPAVEAQDQAPAPDQQQAPRVESVEGDLTKVDSDKKMITVKAADGAEHQFTYNDDTAITGAQEGAQGLAGAEGTKVRVFFTTTNESHTATRIEVQAKK